MSFSRLEDLTKTITKGTTPTSIKESFSDSGIPFLRAQNVNNEVIDDDLLFISDRVHQGPLSRSKIQYNDVLLTIAGTIGRSAVVKKESVTFNCNQAISIIRVQPDKLDPNYLNYFLRTHNAYSQFTKNKVTATISNLSLTQVRNLKIPLPPLPIQKKIVEILDKADALRKKTEQLLSYYDQLAESIFYEMFGDPVKNEKGLEITALKSLIHSVRNGISRRPKTQLDTTGQKVLKLKHIRNNHIDYHCENKIYLTDNEKQKYNVNIGDLLFIRVNGNPEYVGRCAVHTYEQEDVYYNDHIMRVRFNDSINTAFLSFYLNSKFGHHEILKHVKTSAGQFTINQSGLENVQIVLPEIETQRKFEVILKRILKMKLSLSINESDNIYNLVLQKAFKGELVSEDSISA